MLRAYWAWLECARYSGWSSEVARVVRTVMEPGVHLAIVTSGPPHMTHRAGFLVSQATGLPFLMDMRDPWSLAERVHESVASPLWYRLARRYEERCIRQAALIVGNTHAASEALGSAYPSVRDRLITVMNGSDDDPLPRAGQSQRFRIAYAGTIYRAGHPQALLGAAAQVVREMNLSPGDFGIEFMGGEAPGSRSLKQMAAAEGIVDFVSCFPPRGHRDVLEFLAGATMLVTFPGWDDTTVPAKIFECIRFDAWLLALAARRSETERLLEQTRADVVAPHDVREIARVIRRRWQEHRRGERPTRPVDDDRFSRRRQAAILLDAIERVT
jgi:hypothetical protein